MSEQKRLHPAAVFFNFIQVVREAAFVIILGFISFKDNALMYLILASSVILILMIIFSVLSWYRYTYRVEDDGLQIEYGIFIRKKRSISKNRIQSIDLTSSVIHRIFKLTRVNIETAGSSTGAEASLKAVKLSEGEALRRALKMANTVGSTDEQEAVEEERPSSTISFKRLFIAGTTSGSIGVIFGLGAVGFSELEQFIPDGFYDSTLEWIIGLGIMLMVVLGGIGLLLLWALGIAGTMIKYGNFTVTKMDDELFITRGLLEKKQLTIPMKRIQAVGIQESLIRQPLGYVTVFAEVAGGSMDKNEDFSSILFPIMKRDELEVFLRRFLPEYAGITDHLVPLPKRSRKFYLLRSSFIFLIATAVMAFVLPTLIWLPLIVLAGSFYLGVLHHKDGGFRRDGEKLTVRYRIFSKNTITMYHKRVQAFEKKQHRVHVKQKLANVRLSIIGKMGMGKHFTIKELEETDVNELGDWYSYRE